MRGWLEGAGSLGSLGGQNTLAVAFDTRLSGVPPFTGRASRGISRLLAGHDCRMFAGRTRVSYETRPLAEVNEAIADVLHGKATARIVLEP